MFSKSARFYDAIYSFKDYEAEALEVRDLVFKKRPRASTLLDVACGTGLHLQHFATYFEAEGLDLDAGLLAIARQRLPDTPLHEADMRDFTLGKTFDAVTCLFSSIGYVSSEDELRTALGRMAAHLNPGGVLVVEGWFAPEEWEDGHLGHVFVDHPELKIARMNIARSRGRISIVDFHYLVGTPDEISTFDELHELHLFTREEYVAAMEAGGLTVEVDATALMGRGLYIGVKS